VLELQQELEVLLAVEQPVAQLVVLLALLAALFALVQLV